MHVIAVLTKITLVYIGAIFLAFSLSPIKKLISQLPEGSLKNRWITLGVLVMFFIFGYIFYATEYWFNHQPTDGFDLVVPLIFLFGGIFVLLVGRLALRTAEDIKRIALLHHESITDPLMGINNRRYFDQCIEDEINISNRYALPLSLMLIDVDKFKSINDTFGHLSGDEVLKNLATAIKSIVRDSDVVCRYGGEEIAIITPNTSLEKTLILAERLRGLVKKTIMGLHCATQEEIKITISIGVSAIDFENTTCKEDLIKLADEALYKAKDSGRDRVVTLQLDGSQR